MMMMSILLSKHNNNHNKMIMILTIFTHLLSDNKIKLILSENNTNNLNGNLINQNNTCESASRPPCEFWRIDDQQLEN
jgi:hypothetical protein